MFNLLCERSINCHHHEFVGTLFQFCVSLYPSTVRQERTKLPSPFYSRRWCGNCVVPYQCQRQNQHSRSGLEHADTFTPCRASRIGKYRETFGKSIYHSYNQSFLLLLSHFLSFQDDVILRIKFNRILFKVVGWSWLKSAIFTFHGIYLPKLSKGRTPLELRHSLHRYLGARVTSAEKSNYLSLFVWIRKYQFGLKVFIPNQRSCWTFSLFDLYPEAQTRNFHPDESGIVFMKFQISGIADGHGHFQRPSILAYDFLPSDMWLLKAKFLDAIRSVILRYIVK